MKIVGIIGSPRKAGNTVNLVNSILKGAEESGAITRVFNLNELDIKDCQACMGCRKTGDCVINDDMQKIYKEIADADGLVIGSPIYMMQMTALTKLFTDRLYSFYESPKSIENKKLVLAFSQGHPDTNNFANYIEATAGMFTFLGFNVIGNIKSGGNHSTDSVKNKPENIKEAEELGKKLASA